MKNVIPGEVYAIPLFLKDILPMTRVSLKDLRGDDKKFAYYRIIEDLGVRGILVEVFNKVGTLDISIEEVVESMRLFPPIIITPLPIGKGRWRRIGKQENYNKEQDSMYSDIRQKTKCGLRVGRMRKIDNELGDADGENELR